MPRLKLHPREDLEEAGQLCLPLAEAEADGELIQLYSYRVMCFGKVVAELDACASLRDLIACPDVLARVADGRRLFTVLVVGAMGDVNSSFSCRLDPALNDELRAALRDHNRRSA